MANYKINRNKQDLPDEQIMKHKDFSKILEGHQKILRYKDAMRPLYKNPGFMGLVTLLSVVLLVFVLTEKEETGNKKSEKIQIENSDKQKDILKTTESNNFENTSDSINKNKTGVIKPVSELGNYNTLAPVFKTYTVDPEKGAILYNKDARIIIPPKAFTDEEGNIIRKPVQVDFRTFKDPVDFFVSGIPMTVETAKGQQHMQSSGMFEIRAHYGTEPVHVNVQAPITVELTTQSHTGYNYYLFNETTKKWEYIGKENAAVRFMVQANEKDFPELKPLTDIIWEFTVSNRQKDPSAFNYIFSRTWNSFMLSESKDNNKNIVIKKYIDQPDFFAKPVTLYNDKETNSEIIDAKLKEYYQLKIQKDRDEAAIILYRNIQKDWLNTPAGKEYLQWAKSPEGQKQVLSTKLVNTFNVNDFGIYNCDVTVNYPQGGKTKPTFISQDGKKIDVSDFYLVDYSVNALYTFDKGQTLYYNPKSSNTLWASLPGGKIAVFPKEKFRNINNEAHTFTMDVIDVNGKTTDQVKSLLGMSNHVTAKNEEKDKNKVIVYERMLRIEKEKREADNIFYKKDSVQLTKDKFKFESKADYEKRLLEDEAKRKADELFKQKIQSIDDEWYGPLQAEPYYSGGQPAMEDFINKNLKPSEKLFEVVQSRNIKVKFTVEKDGSLSNIQVLGEIPNCATCKNEIIDVFKKMTKWQPGMQNGKAVRRSITVPFDFYNPEY